MQLSSLALNNNGQAAQPSLGGSGDDPVALHSVASDSPNTRVLAEPGSQQLPQEPYLSDLTRDLEMGLPQRRPAASSEGDSSEDLPDECQMDSLAQVTLSKSCWERLGLAVLLLQPLPCCCLVILLGCLAPCVLPSKVPDTACAVQLLRSFWHWLASLVLRASLAVYEFLRNVCSPSEPPLHFVKVEVAPQPGEDVGTHRCRVMSKEWSHHQPDLCSGGCANRARLCFCCNTL